MPIPNAYPPGSPRWWLHVLIDKIIDQQARYDALEDYHIGNHPLPVLDPTKRVMFRHFQLMAKTNYVSLINNAPVGRMAVKEFLFGDGGEPDSDAKKIWAVNDMSLQSKKVHTGASIFGDSYVLVGPIDPETGFPTMTVEDPRIAVVEPHPLFPTKSVAGLRMWEDIYLNQVVAVLYLPDQIYTYLGPRMDRDYTRDAITERDVADVLSHGDWLLAAQEENILGEVPLIHFEWQPDHNGMSLGEAELVLHIQDRINQMVMDRLVIAKSEAFNQQYAVGITAVQEQKGGKKRGSQVKSPFEQGAGNLWITDNKDAKFGQLPSVDFKQILDAVRDDITDIAAITQTPAHYLMGRMVNVSGDTLTQAESGFTSKTRLRMEAMGWGWERVMRMAFKYMGLAKAKEAEASVIWANPMIRKDVDAADAASKWAAVGVEAGVLMENLGDFSAEQIAFSRQHIEEQKQLEQERLLEQKKTAPPGANPQGGSQNRTS